MRFQAVLAVVVSVLGGSGCFLGGGGPIHLRVALDDAQLRDIPATCFNGGVKASESQTSEQVTRELFWTLWDGPENKRFLDVGGFTAEMGDAQDVDFGGNLLEGKDRSFSGQLVDQKVPDGNSPVTFTRVRSLAVKFDELGGAAKGTLTVSSTYQCTNCAQSEPSCELVVSFWGRSVSPAPETSYPP